MALIVQKYGGTSVGTVERIREVASASRRIVAQGHRLVVVVSAMAGETNRLLDLARRRRAPAFRPGKGRAGRERRAGVRGATGVGASGLGLRSAFRSSATRSGSPPTRRSARARIRSIDRAPSARLVGTRHDRRGRRVSGRRRATTTSPRSAAADRIPRAVALAAALSADVCEIYTDVDGVYTSDPRIVPEARKLERISYDEMLELASLGAKVLQIRSVEFAKRYQVPVHVRSSFERVRGHDGRRGGQGHGRRHGLGSRPRPRRGQADLAAACPTDRASRRASSVRSRGAGIVVDMIIQNASRRRNDGSDVHGAARRLREGARRF